jgi:alkylation response protein AidB-like acyl-CoA dehydrogenase
MQVAHGYHEHRNNVLSELRTQISEDANGQLWLSGVKDWVTNIAAADRVIVIARWADSDRLSAVIVDPSRPEVEVTPEHGRPGVLGVSLGSLRLAGYALADQDIVGGPTANITAFIERFEPGSSLGFTARAVGAADSLLRYVLADVTATLSGYSDDAQAVIRFQVARLAAAHLATASVFEQLLALPHPPTAREAHLAKVFCSDSLTDMCQNAAMLTGGASFAGAANPVARAVREATSLRLIDTPNDVLLSRVGALLLP